MKMPESGDIFAQTIHKLILINLEQVQFLITARVEIYFRDQPKHYMKFAKKLSLLQVE